MSQPFIRSFLVCFVLTSVLCYYPAMVAHAQDAPAAAPKRWVETSLTSRVALVIGNATYPYGGQLKNPVNDAVAVAKVLESLGFTVITVTDGTRREMLDAIDNFGDALNTNTVALCYYSGHGIQLNRTNYLLPVDFRGKSRADVEDEAVSMGRILGRLDDKGSPVNVVILDACRTIRTRGSPVLPSAA